jgi:hypothetical protein
MDNQQRRIEERLCWLGGIIDADGMVTATQRKTKSSIHYKPKINVVNTDLRMINETISILDELHIPHYVQSKKDKKNPHYKIKYEILTVGIKRCKMLLPVIIPYLIVKRRRAERLLEFCDLRLSKPYNSKYADEEFRLLDLVRRNCARVHYTNTID